MFFCKAEYFTNTLCGTMPDTFGKKNEMFIVFCMCVCAPPNRSLLKTLYKKYIYFQIINTSATIFFLKLLSLYFTEQIKRGFFMNSVIQFLLFITCKYICYIEIVQKTVKRQNKRRLKNMNTKKSKNRFWLIILSFGPIYSVCNLQNIDTNLVFCN